MNWYSEFSQMGTVFFAAVLGGIIGLEREFARKAAGLRTHVFVSAGSALLVVLSNAIVSNIPAVDDGVLSADPIRMVQAIVIAISFLGAGTIAHERGGEIEGLTTAGSIYMTAGVGIAVGVHEFVLATGSVLMALIILLCVGRIEKRLDHYRATRSAPSDQTSSVQAHSDPAHSEKSQSEKSQSERQSAGEGSTQYRGVGVVDSVRNASQ